MEASLECKNNYLKIYEEEYESKFDDYRDGEVEEKEKFVNEKLSQLPIQIKLDELFWDSDAVSLYSSAMWDEKSIYPRIEPGYAFTKGMSKKLVKKLNTDKFNQGSVILKTKYYNPKKINRFTSSC